MPGEILIGEPTATIEGWTTAAAGSAKKIAPAFSLLAAKGGTVESMRWWNAETAVATSVAVGIYADNGSATAPTGLSPVNNPGAALAEAFGTGLVLTAKTWTEVSGLSLKVTAGTRYWLALNDTGAGTAVKPAAAVSGSTGTLVLKNSTTAENFKGASETWVEQAKKGPIGIQALGKIEETGLLAAKITSSAALHGKLASEGGITATLAAQIRASSRLNPSIEGFSGTPLELTATWGLAASINAGARIKGALLASEGGGGAGAIGIGPEARSHPRAAAGSNLFIRP